MKNWQLRWFVLRADHLYFYKDEEETKPQVCSALKTHKICLWKEIWWLNYSEFASLLYWDGCPMASMQKAHSFTP